MQLFETMYSYFHWIYSSFTKITYISLSLSPPVYMCIYIYMYGVSLSCIFRRAPAVGVGAPDGAGRPERGRQEIRLMIVVIMIIIMIICIIIISSSSSSSSSSGSSSSGVITIIIDMCSYMRGRQDMYRL